MKLLAAAVAAFALQGVPFKATLVGGGHTPTINTRWPYTVKVTDAKGKPLAARITAVVVDPIGGVHPVEFFTSKKTVTNYPIKGVFKDAITWPPESTNYQLKFKVTVRVAKAKRVLTYLLTPQPAAP
jgi:hypothetical protein